MLGYLFAGIPIAKTGEIRATTARSPRSFCGKAFRCMSSLAAKHTVGAQRCLEEKAEVRNSTGNYRPAPWQVFQVPTPPCTLSPWNSLWSNSDGARVEIRRRGA